MSEGDSVDTQLIAACIKGEAGAWADLVTRHKRLVYAIPFRRGLKTEDCKEVFQSVWLDCYNQLHSLRDPQSFRAWLIRITVRKCYQLRQRGAAYLEVSLSSSELDDLNDESGTGQFIERLLQEQAIQVGIARLTLRCQEVINALFFEDPQPTYADLARRLGLSGNSIGFTRDRCLDCLGKILRELGYQPTTPG